MARISRKKMTVKDYFAKKTPDFIKFGEFFSDLLTDEELMLALAQKDIEKLAKVWKLVFDMLAENTGDQSAEKLSELIDAMKTIDNG